MNLRISMRRYRVLSVMALILITSISFSQQRIAGKAIKSGTWNGRDVEYIDREVAIKLKEGFSSAQLSATLNQFQGKIKQDFDELRWGWVELPEGMDIMPLVLALQNLPIVEAVEPNFVDRIALEPNDPYYRGTSPATYPYQWALKNTGQSPPGGTIDADIDAPEAWDITTGSSNVIIAILDSGIPMQNGSLSHPDLDDQNKIMLGPDYIDDPNDPSADLSVRDYLGHGTHVAGIAAAESNNGDGIAGVAWNCKLMIIQVFDANGNSSTQAFYNGVKYAVDYDRTHSTYMVINYSGGGGPAQQKLDAVIYARNYGVMVVASAGNNVGGPVLFPAAYSTSYSNVNAVSSTNHNDVFSTFTNEGPEVNVSAPGGYGSYLDGTVVRLNGSQNLGRNIFSTTPNYSFTLQYDPAYAGDPYTSDISQTYSYLAGTSMSAPHVSGLVALILSTASFSPFDLRGIIQKTADDKGTLGFDETYGWGRINAYQALLLTHAYSNKSMATTATASNNGRRMVIGSNGNYHLVFESGVTSGGNVLSEIYYRSSSDGIAWGTPMRLSAGNEQNRNPSIAERSGKLYIAWQRKTGSNTYDILFRHFNGSSWESIQTVKSGISVTSDPIPVIAVSQPSYSFEMMAVYRTNGGLKSRRSTSITGSAWETEMTVTTNSSAANPSLPYPLYSSYSRYLACQWPYLLQRISILRLGLGDELEQRLGKHCQYT